VRACVRFSSCRCRCALVCFFPLCPFCLRAHAFARPRGQQRWQESSIVSPRLLCCTRQSRQHAACQLSHAVQRCNTRACNTRQQVRERGVHARQHGLRVRVHGQHLAPMRRPELQVRAQCNAQRPAHAIDSAPRAPDSPTSAPGPTRPHLRRDRLAHVCAGTGSAHRVPPRAQSRTTTKPGHVSGYPLLYGLPCERQSCLRSSSAESAKAAFARARLRAALRLHRRRCLCNGRSPHARTRWDRRAFRYVAQTGFCFAGECSNTTGAQPLARTHAAAAGAGRRARRCASFADGLPPARPPAPSSL
jgi:hypothetical protein